MFINMNQKISRKPCRFYQDGIEDFSKTYKNEIMSHLTHHISFVLQNSKSINLVW